SEILLPVPPWFYHPSVVVIVENAASLRADEYLKRRGRFAADVRHDEEREVARIDDVRVVPACAASAAGELHAGEKRRKEPAALDLGVEEGAAAAGAVHNDERAQGGKVKVALGARILRGAPTSGRFFEDCGGSTRHRRRAFKHLGPGPQ
ncbi:hypothetical protein AURDEDRAFT_187687, partial [Auricularia subglabra TFB-10046 SS5]